MPIVQQDLERTFQVGSELRKIKENLDMYLAIRSLE